MVGFGWFLGLNYTQSIIIRAKNLRRFTKKARNSYNFEKRFTSVYL